MSTPDSSSWPSRRPAAGPRGPMGPCSCQGCSRQLEWCLPLAEERWAALLESISAVGIAARLTRNPSTLLVEWAPATAFTPCLLEPADLVELHGSLLLRLSCFRLAYAALEQSGATTYRSFWFGGPTPGHSFRLLLADAHQAGIFQELAETALRLQDFTEDEPLGALEPCENPRQPLVGAEPEWPTAECPATIYGAQSAVRVSTENFFEALQAMAGAELPLEVTVYSEGVRHQVLLPLRSHTVAGELFRGQGPNVEWHVRRSPALQLWLVQPSLGLPLLPYLEGRDGAGNRAWRLRLHESAELPAASDAWHAALELLG